MKDFAELNIEEIVLVSGGQNPNPKLDTYTDIGDWIGENFFGPALHLFNVQNVVSAITTGYRIVGWWGTIKLQIGIAVVNITVNVAFKIATGTSIEELTIESCAETGRFIGSLFD